MRMISDALHLIFLLLCITACSTSEPITRERVPAFVEYNEQINGTRLHYAVRTLDPSKPYLVFLSGGPGSSSAFERAFVEVMGLAQNTVIFDQRGCGKSERNVDRESFTFEILASDLDDVLNHAHVAKAVLFGHSWGGIYGVEYTKRHPEKVAAMVFVDGVVSWKTALENYHSYAIQYAKDHLELIKNLKSGASLSESEMDDFQRFCRRMKMAHQEDKNNPYEACQNNPALLTQSQQSQIVNELIEDMNSIQSLWPKNKWKAWSARNIRDKYGMYQYDLLDKPLIKRIIEMSHQLYTPTQAKYSEVMQEGLNRSESRWPNEYDTLQQVKFLKKPFFYVYGAHDVLFRSDGLAAYTKNTWGPDHVIEFTNSGHHPLSEQPELANELIQGIYSEILK